MDPALWELLRAEAGAGGDQEIEAIIRLAGPGIEIPGVRIVSRFGTIVTCRLPLHDVIGVRARPEVISIKAARGLSPGSAPPGVSRPPGPRPTDIRRGPGLTLTGKSVVVASTDWGVDVDSAAFRWPADQATAGEGRLPGGTRFIALWDQRDAAPGPRPDPYGYGTVHDREQIDAALRSPQPYQRLGYHPATADQAGLGAHGTHVLDIAAGNGQAGGPVGIAPEADLICVHLADRDSNGNLSNLDNLGNSVRLLEAVDFISGTAGPKPCVINISAGRTCGPKDGTTLVERALDQLLAATPGRFVVNSAGNYYGWRTHASGSIAPGQTRSLTFSVDPADVTLNELEVWYDGADEFAVRICPPGRAAGRPVLLGERSDLLIDGRIAGRVYHRECDPNNHDNHIVAYLDPIGNAGDWTVILEARRVKDGRFHAWIERDDYCSGCQARFIPADSRRRTTVGTIATSRLPLVVGAYDAHDPARPAAPFSSSGPSRDLRPKPDLAAPGVGVLAARSASVLDVRNPGLLVRKSGTSMAAPHVTGAVALCMQALGSQASAREIRSVVLGSCDPPEDPAARSRLGHGYLNIQRLVAGLQPEPGTPVRTLNVKEPAMNTEDAVLLLTSSPATAYREYLYRPHGRLARWIDDNFDTLARPGQQVEPAAEVGDMLLEVTLGRHGLGRCVVLGTGTRSADLPRRLPPGQLLLRPRGHAAMSGPLPVEPGGEQPGTVLDSRFPASARALADRGEEVAPVAARLRTALDSRVRVSGTPERYTIGLELDAPGGGQSLAVAVYQPIASTPLRQLPVFIEDIVTSDRAVVTIVRDPAAALVTAGSPPDHAAGRRIDVRIADAATGQLTVTAAPPVRNVPGGVIVDCRENVTQHSSGSEIDQVVGSIAPAEGGFASVEGSDRGIFTWGQGQWTVTGGELQGVLAFIKARRQDLYDRYWGLAGLEVSGDPRPVFAYNGQRFATTNAQMTALFRADPGRLRAFTEIFAQAGMDPQVQRLQRELMRGQVIRLLSTPVQGHVPGELLNTRGKAFFYSMWVNGPRYAQRALASAAGQVPAGTQVTDAVRDRVSAALEAYFRDSAVVAWSSDRHHILAFWGEQGRQQALALADRHLQEPVPGDTWSAADWTRYRLRMTRRESRYQKTAAEITGALSRGRTEPDIPE